MSIGVKELKDKIRKEIIRRLQKQSYVIRDKRSKKINEKLLFSDEFKNSEVIMTYVSLKTEVDTYGFIKEALKKGKKIVVPYLEPDSRDLYITELTTFKDLEKGFLGIYQPKLIKNVPFDQINLVIVPGIAYDKKNTRLGRGKAYYDRFLSKLDLSKIKIIGLGFSFQVLDFIPLDCHDIPMHKIITD